jgi:HK97 family phage major capsid protein
MAIKADCSGWATKANMRCSDGRTILKNAFEECDGATVPVVWNHEHDDPNAVLGHALLENRADGVYAYITFNNTDSGRNAKMLVQHKDVDRLSIYANKLVQRGGDVIHGIIREVSLVLAGANPGAVIDTVLAHGDDSEVEGYIRSGEIIEVGDTLTHSDDNSQTEKKKGESKMAESNKNPDDKTIKDIFESMTDEQKKAVQVLIGMALEEAHGESENENDKSVQHSDKPESTEDSTDGETIQDVLDSMTDTQRKVVNALVGMALEEAGEDDDEAGDDENEGGDKTMKHSLFDQETNTQDQDVLSHAEQMDILKEAKRTNRSLADTVLAHGITNIDYMFPDAQKVENVPGFIKREDLWVTDVMNSVHKTPFSRVKSVFADITEDDARAKGYIKGNQKKDEVFKMLKRVTTPVTVYKHQSLDRDDMVDITDFDVVAWLKSEMKTMLNEELARAILVGDGRTQSSADKINEQNIRPIWTDDDVYTVKTAVAITKATTEEEKARSFIKACIKSRKNYKGSGNPVMYMSEDMLTNCLLLEDTNKRVIYDTVEKLATALRVSKIVPVPVMEDLSRVVGADTHILGGIYVNLVDYNVGTDMGGAVNMFDDFDIDYNKQKYLIETRCSGALIKPYSAVAVEFVGKTAELNPVAA